MSDQSSTPARAVLWDMDGTLLDSGPQHWETWRDALAAEGFELTPELFAASFGQRNDTILRGYFGADLPMSEIERIGNAKEERYREMVRSGEIELLPGVRGWLERLHADGWQQAIASSAPFLNIQALLDTLDIAQYFEAITSAEDVQRGKPDPQVFLVAAAKLGVPPELCIVVEDAPAGVEGACRAGMRSIGVLTTQPALDADLVVERLDQLPPDAFERLLEARNEERGARDE
jgi:beta-phosphoglucomutase